MALSRSTLITSALALLAATFAVLVMGGPATRQLPDRNQIPGPMVRVTPEPTEMKNTELPARPDSNSPPNRNLQLLSSTPKLANELANPPPTTDAAAPIEPMNKVVDHERVRAQLRSVMHELSERHGWSITTQVEVEVLVESTYLALVEVREDLSNGVLTDEEAINKVDSLQGKTWKDLRGVLPPEEQRELVNALSTELRASLTEIP